MAGNHTAHDLVRTAMHQMSYLDLWLTTHLAPDEAAVYDALLTVDIWRQAVRQPDPGVERDRALIELAQASTQAGNIIDHLEHIHDRPHDPFIHCEV